MTGSAIAGVSGRSVAVRWTLAAVLALVLHGAPIGAWSFWGTSELPPGFEDPPISVEVALLPSAPSLPEPEQEVTPGPQSAAQEETAPPPEEAKPEEAQQLAVAPTPREPEPEIVIPEKKQEAEPEKKPQPEEKKAEKPAKKPPPKEARRAPREQRASRESAPTRAQRNTEAMASAVSGASSAAAAASYYDRVRAALQGAKQNLPASVPRGVAAFSFTLSRSGRVTGSRIIRSSGIPAVDAEALAMVGRASFPPFPAEMKESSKTYPFTRTHAPRG